MAANVEIKVKSGLELFEDFLQEEGVIYHITMDKVIQRPSVKLLGNHKGILTTVLAFKQMLLDKRYRGNVVFTINNIKVDVIYDPILEIRQKLSGL